MYIVLSALQKDILMTAYNEQGKKGNPILMWEIDPGKKVKVIFPDDVYEASFKPKKMGLKNMRITKHILHFISAVNKKLVDDAECSVM